ncbi:hypothetical protein Gogos_018220 [Gossypium gossypioides]|uniref:DUF4283 domain-containing protein n=1 Tax=Gossypium gossypioides TaxID=34282 RepID=A0A7J9BDE4_GOSGO|nr:hypothetical protein [Gossypium gossypioides]
MRSMLENAWHPIGGVSISDMENGRFLFRFYFEVNVDQARQLGSFIGVFFEYDASTIQLGYKGIMRLRVRVDVMKPLKRKKKLTLSNGASDISLRAQSKRNVAWRSRWLVEDGGDGSSNYGNSTNKYGGRNLRRSQFIPVDQGANVGFPPKIPYSLKGKSNISSIPGPTKVGELGQNNNKGKNNFDKDMAMSFLRRHIDIMMDEDSDGKNWRCTDDFYRALEENLMEAYWNLLCSLNDCPQIPWLVIRDFN